MEILLNSLLLSAKLSLWYLNPAEGDHWQIQGEVHFVDSALI